MIDFRSWFRDASTWVLNLPTLIVLPTIAVTLGAIGFEQLRDDSNILDSLYRAVQMLGLNFEVTDEWIRERGGIPPLLSIGRWVAAIATFTIVIELVSRRFGLWIRLLVQGLFPTDRVVLLGFGDINHAIVQSLATRRVTAVDKTFDEADRRMARRRGILLLEGDLADHRTYASVRIARASAVYVACGSDEVNIQVARSAQRIISERSPNSNCDRLMPRHKPEIYAHLSGVRFMRDIENARDLAFSRSIGIETFSLKLEAARDLMVRTRLPQRARDSGHDRVHAVICGMGDQGEAALVELALGGHSAGMRPPRITVIDRDAKRIEAEFRANYPELVNPSVIPDEARPMIRFRENEIRALDVEEDLAWLAEEDVPTAFLIATSDDSLNMGTALRIETAMQRRRLPHALICVRQWDAVTQIEQVDTNLSLHIVRFGNSRVTAQGWIGRRDHHLKLAKELHAHYTNDADPNSAWHELADIYRRANLRAVRHGSSKLIDLNLQWRGMANGLLPNLDLQMLPQLKRAIAEGLGRDRPLKDREVAMLWDVARSEHARWAVDRAASGFRPAKNGRSDYLGEHNLLIDFRALPDKERQYDNHLLEVLASRTNYSNRAALTRVVAVIDDAGVLIESDGDNPTELQVHVSDPYNLADPRKLAESVKAWADNRTACRLHLLIHDPVRYPKLVSSEALLGVAALIEGLNEEIVCDVTWRAAEVSGARSE